MLRSQVYLSRVTVGSSLFPPVLYFYPAGDRTPTNDNTPRDEDVRFRPVLILFLDSKDGEGAAVSGWKIERRRHRQQQYIFLARFLFWIQRWRFHLANSGRVIYR